MRFRIESGSRHSIAVGGCRSSSANFSPIVEKYQFIKAPPPICNQSSTTYCSNLNYIYLLQKRIVRLISKTHYLANTAPLFSKRKVLDIYTINSFSVATFMYSYHHNLLPSSFRNLFLTSNQVHHYETRLASQYSPHFCRTNIKPFSILYRGPTIWNSLPVTITTSSTISVIISFIVSSVD